MERIQFVGACIGYTVSALTLISLIVKPIRTRLIPRLIGWIKGVNKTDENSEMLARIEARLDQQERNFNERLDKQEDKLDKIALGSQASLRNNILQLVDKCLAKESITAIEKLNLIDMYNAYHDLGGDTYATARYKLALELEEKN